MQVLWLIGRESVHRKIRSDRIFAFVHCNVSSPYLRSTSTSHDLKSKNKEESSFHIGICGRWSADRSISNFFLGAGIILLRSFFSFTSTLVTFRNSESKDCGSWKDVEPPWTAASQHILTLKRSYTRTCINTCIPCWAIKN